MKKKEKEQVRFYLSSTSGMHFLPHKLHTVGNNFDCSFYVILSLTDYIKDFCSCQRKLNHTKMAS